MMSVSANIENIRQAIPSGIELIAVSKTMPEEVIMEAYNAGQRKFGENKVQELASKQLNLPSDIQWHFIGHLQTNKVKYIVPFVEMIQSVDSYKLLKEIDKQAAKAKRSIQCLLQFHIAEEETKYGFNLEEAKQMFQTLKNEPLHHVIICGVMGMATFTDDEKQLRKEFKSLKTIFENIKKDYLSEITNFKEISMGMSGDYILAIEEGATIIRVGSNIFGNRLYNLK